MTSYKECAIKKGKQLNLTFILRTHRITLLADMKRGIIKVLRANGDFTLEGLRCHIHVASYVALALNFRPSRPHGLCGSLSSGM